MIDVLDNETERSVLHYNQLLIDTSAIRHNIGALRSILPPRTRIMAIVKAYAYGTDAYRLARLLLNEDIDLLGVAHTIEAIELRNKGIASPIFITHATPEEAQHLFDYDLEIGVGDEDMLRCLAFEGIKRHGTISCHLHVDTGMTRFGCPPEEALKLAKMIDRSPVLKLKGLMTHFAVAEDPKENSFTSCQIDLFNAVQKELYVHQIFPEWVHPSNSSGAIRWHSAKWNMVRCGLSLFGIHSSEAEEKCIQSRIAASLISRVVGINYPKKGATVSYGRTYRIEQENAKIAIIPFGYHDGWQRAYSQRSEVIINGMRAKMVGTICMDYSMVDISHIPDVKVGDEVLIFGKNQRGDYISPRELARQLDTTPHELLASLGPRVIRQLL